MNTAVAPPRSQEITVVEEGRFFTRPTCPDGVWNKPPGRRIRLAPFETPDDKRRQERN